MPDYFKIAEDIEKGLPIKQIAFRWNTTRRVVEYVKAKFFSTVLVRKEVSDQESLFEWAGRRKP